MLAEDDHREIGRKLDLFHFQEEAPGMAFWHPRGFAALSALSALIRRHAERDGFAEVKTPELLRLPVWEASGHLQHFRQGMFVVEEGDAAFKPVSCPGHLEILRRRSTSYRDLPLRYSELGVVHRNEPSGTLHGLFRLRQFTQDDGHVFCAEDQVESEVARFAGSLVDLYRKLGFAEVGVSFATRPDDRAGSDAVWDRAEALLSGAAERAGIRTVLAEKSGAFYGPKLEFSLPDRLGRAWQCGTIQLDLVLPERFDVSFIDRKNERQRPMMLHRATLGSLERFLGVLLEQHRGALPGWLAPEQVVVLPVDESSFQAAENVREAFRRAELRVAWDGRDENLSRRVLAAHENGIPFVAVIGAREARQNTVSLRARDGQRVLSLSDAVSQIKESCAPPL
jgi:threonyl-tRNA synthetase